jgi:hypothetical protein
MDIAALATNARLWGHWYMRPLRAVQRIGVLPMWLGILVLLAGMSIADVPPVLTIGVGVFYLLLCVYTWTAVPITRWLMARA